MRGPNWIDAAIALLIAAILILIFTPPVLGQESPDVMVNPALERQWFEAWEGADRGEAVWCGYGMIRRNGTIVVSNHEPATVVERTTTYAERKPCPPVNENAGLVATIHTHPSLSHIFENAGRHKAMKVKNYRQEHNLPGGPEYECDLSPLDRATFSETARFGEGTVVLSIVICAPGRYAYRTSDNIFGGQPTIIQRETHEQEGRRGGTGGRSGERGAGSVDGGLRRQVRPGADGRAGAGGVA